MADTITNEEAVVEALEDTKSSEAVEEAKVEEPKEEVKEDILEETAPEEGKEEVKLEKAEEVKAADVKVEPEIATEDAVGNTETAAAELAADDEADNAALESADDFPKQILLTSRTPLYRGPSKASRISGASGGATVLGKVGEFTKISYVRRGVGVQEGYVILDA